MDADTVFMTFAAIVETETTEQGRRMIEMWACGADADSLVLSAAFDTMWKA